MRGAGPLVLAQRGEDQGMVVDRAQSVTVVVTAGAIVAAQLVRTFDVLTAGSGSPRACR
jgi:hypothetical protein